MASNDPVVEIIGVMPPGASYAQEDTRTGGSTPAEALTVWNFDGSTQEYVDFKAIINAKYSGGGLTFLLPWMAASGNSGSATMGLGFYRLDASHTIVAAKTYTFVKNTTAANTTTGGITYCSIPLTAGANMDSATSNDVIIIRVTRDTETSGNTLSATDIQVIGLWGKET